MTVRIHSTAPNNERINAESFADALLSSQPALNNSAITVDILFGLLLPERQIDLVVLYHDPRPPADQLKTPAGTPIHSFVLVVEVKRHSPDLIRFEGPKVLVRYGGQWSDATSQCDEQTYALKRYQKTTYEGSRRRGETFVQRAIWLAHAHSSYFGGCPAAGSVPVHFADLSWEKLTKGLHAHRGSVRALADSSNNPEYHSVETLRTDLLHQVLPTRLDLHRINALTQTRFDAEKTAYIQNLGNGLLVLRGRAGTGKTLALVQIALHLAREGRRTVLLTYNHGLIADIARALRFIGKEDPALQPMPVIKTRYAFIQLMFAQTFGSEAEKEVRAIPDLDEREETRRKLLMDSAAANDSSFDFALVDEGQDWTEPQRDLLFKLFGPGHVVVADGVDQFVGQDRCVWDESGVPINRRHRLQASRRTKSATCRTVAEIARELDLFDWDLEPDPDTHGGRFTVLVEPDARQAVTRALDILESDQRKNADIKAVDNLVCLPTTKMAKGVNYAALFDQAVEARSGDSWRGFDEGDRRIYPLRSEQLRAIYYQSCRGMEGWTSLCLGLDTFFDFQIANARIDASRVETLLSDEAGLFYTEELLQSRLARERRLFAVNWLMIPLTRSIDHLVLHLADEQSALGKILEKVSTRCNGAIEWIR